MSTPSPARSAYTKARDELFDKIATLLQSAASQLEDASRLYVQGIDGSADFAVAFRERFPRLNSMFVANLERVGRGILDARLMAAGVGGCDILVKLPPSQQAAVFDSGLDVWTGEAETKHMRIQDMPKSLIQQCISRDGHVLTPEEQAAAMEGKRAAYRESLLRRKTMEVRGVEVLYEVKGKSVKIIHPPVTLTAKELRALLAEVTK